MNDTPLYLEAVDLTNDPAATLYQKLETVTVTFATDDGTLMSLEGPNAYRSGDALVCAGTGERWVVSRERFERKYEVSTAADMGVDGGYRNVAVPVWARQFDSAFTIERAAGSDRLTGAPGDWLLQYAPGDYGVVQQARFARVYRQLID